MDIPSYVIIYSVKKAIKEGRKSLTMSVKVDEVIPGDNRRERIWTIHDSDTNETARIPETDDIMPAREARLYFETFKIEEPPALSEPYASTALSELLDFFAKNKIKYKYDSDKSSYIVQRKTAFSNKTARIRSPTLKPKDNLPGDVLDQVRQACDTLGVAYPGWIDTFRQQDTDVDQAMASIKYLLGEDIKIEKIRQAGETEELLVSDPKKSGEGGAESPVHIPWQRGFGLRPSDVQLAANTLKELDPENTPNFEPSPRRPEFAPGRHRRRLGEGYQQAVQEVRKRAGSDKPDDLDQYDEIHIGKDSVDENSDALGEGVKRPIDQLREDYKEAHPEEFEKTGDGSGPKRTD